MTNGKVSLFTIQRGTSAVVSTPNVYNITDKNLIGSGGQGSVYKVTSDIAVKISDGVRMPMDQIRAIHDATYQCPDIISPQYFAVQDNTALNDRSVLGYGMKYLGGYSPLVTIFSKAAKVRNQVTDKKLEKMIVQLRNIVEYCHDHKLVIADLNEYNILVDQATYTDLKMIDLDGCAVDKYKASAIMESVRDWTSKDFTNASDWFSFAVLAFQMFTGIHPFKGTHPKHGNLKSRVISGTSVFNKEVKVPLPAKDFQNNIPPDYLQWFQQTFEYGKRELPPLTMASVAKLTPQVVVIKNTGDLKSKVIFGADSEIVDCFGYMDSLFIQTVDGVYADHFHKFIPDIPPYAVIVPGYLSPRPDLLVTYVASRGSLSARAYNLQDGTQISVPNTGVTVNKLIVSRDSGNLPIGLCGSSVSNVLFSINTRVEFPDSLMTSVGTDVYHMSEYSTQIFDSCAIQMLMGNYHLTTISDRIREAGFIAGFRGHRIVNASYRGSITVIVSEKKGNLYRYIYNVNTGEISKGTNISSPDINFIRIPDKDIYLMTQEESLLMFSGTDFGKSLRVIELGDLAGCRISTAGRKVVAMKDNMLYELSLG